MPRIDPYDHRPTDAELDSWDENFEYCDTGVTCAKMLRTVIRELKAERARNNPDRLGRPAYAPGGRTIDHPTPNRFQFRLRGEIDRTGGFAAMNQRAAQINAQTEPMRQYAEQDATFTQGMVQALFKTPHEIRPGHRVMTDVKKRGDIPELHGTVIHTKKKGAYPSVKVAWDNGTEGYISGRFLKPSDLPEFTLDTMEQDYTID